MSSLSDMVPRPLLQFSRCWSTPTVRCTMTWAPRTQYCPSQLLGVAPTSYSALYQNKLCARKIGTLGLQVLSNRIALPGCENRK